MRGFVLGLLTAGVPSLLAFWVVQATGTGPTMMGDLGEQWTAGELRKLRKRGWRVVNHVLLRSSDIDHVLIGPGGLYAVETKWRSDAASFDASDDRVLAAARSVTGSARSLQLWQNIKNVGRPQVHPVLVLWGPGIAQRADIAPVRRLDQCTVVLGPHFEAWARTLAGGELTSAQVTELWTVVEAQVQMRDDRETDPLPPSLEQLFRQAFLTAAAASLAVVATGRVLRHVHGTPVVVALVALAMLGVVARRVPQLRYIGLAWATVTLSFGVAVFVAAIVDRVRLS